MRIVPAIQFYLRRHEQLDKLFDSHRGTAAVLELARAVLPIVNRRWPHLNPEGLLEDVIETAEQVFEDSDSEDARRFPDGKQI